MIASLERAELLMNQERYDLAERELRGCLAVAPDGPWAHALLAECLSQLKRHSEALREADSAIGFGPDNPDGHYARARVLMNMDRSREAEGSIREAIRLNPYQPGYFATLAHALIDQRRWAEAESAASQGLRLNPEDTSCANLRALALRRMGRRDDAAAGIASALARDPDNTYTHANQGWALLERGRYREAERHFREALRLDAENEAAREGVITALKARNPLYRAIFRYFTFTAGLSRRAGWALVLGLWFGYRVASGLAASTPQLRTILYPLMIAYTLFVFVSWTATPLSNMFLFFHPFGRLALTPFEKLGAGLMALCLLIGAVGLTSGLAMDYWPLAFLGLVGLLMSIPVGGTFTCRRDKDRWMLGAFTIFLAAAGLLAALYLEVDPSGQAGMPFSMVFMFGIILFQFLGNRSALR